MSQTVGAIFDGEVLRPDEPIDLEPNTRVRVTIEPTRASEKKGQSFLQIARSLKLEGPPDWSERLDDYLYGIEIVRMNEVFLDSACAIALAALNDQYHERAIALADELEAESVRLITTRAVVLEIGNALSKARHRKAATDLLEGLENDPNVQIVPLSEELYERARQLYQDRPDKEWGLTDCVSFVDMQDVGLTQALTSDSHFEQAGFRALLREK